jgi:hypothetical protein
MSLPPRRSSRSRNVRVDGVDSRWVGLVEMRRAVAAMYRDRKGPTCHVTRILPDIPAETRTVGRNSRAPGGAE